MTPDIKIKIDPQEDIKAFLFFLNHPFFVRNRNSILKAHPKLEECVDDPDFKDRVRDYVLKFYQDKQEEIERIVAENETKLGNKERAFELLAKLMQYKWDSSWEVTAYISILPFSPFSDKKFNYSIFGELYKNNPVNKSILSVAVHEISHMIFFDKLKEIADYKNSAIYYLKEAITTALINNEELKSILETKEDPGNPDIQEIYIQEGDDEPVTLIQYVDKQIRESGSFDDVIKLLSQKFMLSKDQFDEKREIWNKFGKSTLDNKNQINKFREPVLIK